LTSLDSPHSTHHLSHPL
jgi:vacuolar protein sorting-associated protein 29